MTLRRILAVLVLAIIFVAGMTIQSYLAPGSRTAAPHVTPAVPPALSPALPSTTATVPPSVTAHVTTTSTSPTTRPHRGVTVTPAATVESMPTPQPRPQQVAAQGADIFLPATAFILPIANHRVKTTMVTLDPQGFSGPIKPVVRTQYDLSHSPYVYRVDVFSSTRDTAASYAWQDQHGTIPYLPITHPATPDEHIYQSGNTLTAMLTYRNVELFMNRTLASASPLASSSLAVQQTLSTERAVLVQVMSNVQQPGRQGTTASSTQATTVPTTDTPQPADTPMATDTSVAADTAVPGAKAVDAGDSRVQQVLTFEPACTTNQVNSDNIATRVESQEGLTDYVGSSSYPGSFTIAPGPLGASIVTWILPKHQLFSMYTFRISQDGSHIVSMNTAAYSILC